MDSQNTPDSEANVKGWGGKWGKWWSLISNHITKL